MMGRTALGKIGGELLGGFDRAAELDPIPGVFRPGPDGFHLQPRVAHRTPVGSERLILLGISGIEADKGLSLHLLDNEGIRVPPGVIGLVGQVDRPFLDLVPSALSSRRSRKATFSSVTLLGKVSSTRQIPSLLTITWVG